jgi:predicted ATPase
MEGINVSKIHEKILKFLLEQKKKNPELTFSLRKSDLNKRLSIGYWFHGNDDYIAISFWTGMDWQSKVPNISYVILPLTGECFLQFSAKDSSEKDDLFTKLFRKRFDLDQYSKSFYSSPLKFHDSNDYLKSLKNFLTFEKKEIDIIISKNKKLFKTKQNSRNQIGFISEEEFQKNFKKIQKFRETKFTNNLPIGLSGITIKDYGLIDHLEINNLPADAQWIFFTGENGTGKSTILKAIAIGITNGSLALGPKTNVSGNYSIEITLQKDGKKSHKRKILKVTSGSTKKFEILSKGLVCFGPVRLNIQEQRFSLAGKSNGRTLLHIFERPFNQLFSTISPLIDVGYVYNRNIAISKELKDNQEKLSFIIEAITSICDSIVDIKFAQGMRYIEVDKNLKILGKNENGTPFQNLASGYKSIIAMVSHMMLHLYYQQPEINDPSLLEGIVIIDEIDLHFHPKMQRDLVVKLSQIFPRIQFIASTHSPIPLLGAPQNSPIFTTAIDAERGISVERMNLEGEIADLLPNAILTSPIFNLQEIIPKSHDRTELINTNDNYSDVIFYRMLDEKLNQIKKKYLPND